MAISDYSTTASSNTSVGGVSIAEGMAPGNVNDAIRAQLADLASYYSGNGQKFTGNVGIGVTPTVRFHISGTGTTANSKAIIASAASTLGLGSSASANESFIGTDGATPFYLYTNGTEAVRLDSTQNVLIGASSLHSNERLSVAKTGSGNRAAVLKNDDSASASAIVWNAATTGDNVFLGFSTEAGGTSRGSIDYNRGGTAVRYNTTSDARLKENVADAQDAGSIIDGIRVRSFDWKAGGHTDYGFVAQELVEHVPDAVKVGDAGETVSDAWQVDYSKLVPLLVKEVQSLRARVAQLEAQ